MERLRKLKKGESHICIHILIQKSISYPTKKHMGEDKVVLDCLLEYMADQATEHSASPFTAT